MSTEENKNGNTLNHPEELSNELQRVTEEFCETAGIEPKALTGEQIARLASKAEVRLHIKQTRQEERAAAEQLKLERDAATAALRASQALGVRNATSNKARITAERAQAMVDGPTFYKMSDAQRLALLGEDPTQLETLRTKSKEIFGRGSDSRAALDLSKSEPGFYNRLREISKLLKTFGA